jgi:hypothetical protein
MREIELYGIKASIPEHPRFEMLGGDWYFIGEVGARFPLEEPYTLVSDRRFESACCIAIVAWEQAMGEHTKKYEAPAFELIDNDDDFKAYMHCSEQAGAWRTILRKSQEEGK